MSANPDIEAARTDRLSKLELRRLHEREKAERLRLRRERIEQANREHAVYLREPLISRDLLSDAERAAIRERVRGRCRWYREG